MIIKVYMIINMIFTIDITKFSSAKEKRNNSINSIIVKYTLKQI